LMAGWMTESALVLQPRVAAIEVEFEERER
jgi:hypothetical protein